MYLYINQLQSILVCQDKVHSASTSSVLQSGCDVVHVILVCSAGGVLA